MPCPSESSSCKWEDAARAPLRAGEDWHKARRGVWFIGHQGKALACWAHRIVWAQSAKWNKESRGHQTKPSLCNTSAHQGSHVKNLNWAGHFACYQEPAFHRIFYFWPKRGRPGNSNSAGNQIFCLQVLLYCPMGDVLRVPDLLLFSLLSLTRLCCSQYVVPTWISRCTRVGYTSEEHLKVLPLARP